MTATIHFDTTSSSASLTHHVVFFDIAEDKGKETSEELNKTYPGKVTFIKCDVSDEGSITRAFDEVLRQFKQLDVVVNNAGTIFEAPESWRKSCDINIAGLISGTLKAVKHMRVDEGGAGGTIVNVASLAGLVPCSPAPVYCGTKAAVIHFSQSLSAEPFYNNTGIRVLTLCLGATNTPFVQKLLNDDKMPVLAEFLKSFGIQKGESAAAAFLEMFKNGENASVWMSQNDKPVEEITHKIKAYHQMFI